ncbi:hypothetical protein ACMFMG_003234 [Clarireedia jacksonii]
MVGGTSYANGLSYANGPSYANSPSYANGSSYANSPSYANGPLYSQRNVIRGLGDNMICAGCTSSEDERDYLPYSFFMEIVSDSTIRSLPYSTSLKEWILRDARRVFAILVLLDNVDEEVICALRDSNFNDKHLPIRIDKNKAPCPVALLDPSGNDKVLGGFRNQKCWGYRLIHKFEMQQWFFLAPVFELSKEYDLFTRTPLPFLWKSAPLGKGSFGVVYQAQIHAAHQTFFDTKENEEQPYIAIKMLSSDMEYRTEYDILEIVRQVDDEHLIKILASYQQGKSTSYLMFKWADGGNLHEFWMTPEYAEAPLTPDMVQWCLFQMKGLAGAIHKLHNFDNTRNIRHGDLKPQNILRFKEPATWGKLQIADMGQTKIHSLATDLRLSDKNIVTGTSRYNSPEASTNARKGGSRSDDMWAIGCIFLEFIIWALCGKVELDDFMNSFPMIESYFLMEGTTENPRPQTFKLQSSVEIEIQGIRKLLDFNVKTGSCVSKGLKDLLEFILDELLIIDSTICEEEDTPMIDSPQIVLHPLKRTTTDESDSSHQNSSSRRAKAKILSEKLEDICSKPLDSSYYFDDRLNYVRSPLPQRRKNTSATSNFLSPPDRDFGITNRPVKKVHANTEVNRN